MLLISYADLSLVLRCRALMIFGKANTSQLIHCVLRLPQAAPMSRATSSGPRKAFAALILV